MEESLVPLQQAGKEMINFDYLKPSSAEEAIKLLQEYGDRAMLIAGGTDVMVGIRQKKFFPEALISLKGIRGLDYIEPFGDGMKIGALATHRQVGESPFVRKSFTALADAVDHLGSLQIRNVATIGGNISNALPSADTACPLLIFDTQARIRGPLGERSLPLEEFFIGPGKTALGREEILLEFFIPSPPPNSGTVYWKHARRQAMEIAMLGMAMMLAVEVKNASIIKEAFARGAGLEELFDSLDKSEIYCHEARISLGVAASTPIRVKSPEEILRGERLNTQKLLEAGMMASQEAQPRDTMRGSAWYRKRMIEILPKRLALRCLKRILSSEERKELR